MDDASLMKAVSGADVSRLREAYGYPARRLTAKARPAPVFRGTQEEQSGIPARRWAINGDFLTLRPTGVARYAKEVTAQLDALIAEGHPLTRGLALELIAPRTPDVPLTAIPTRLVPEFSHPRLPQLWVQLQLPLHVTGGLLSFCNLAPVAVKRHIVCIHDLHTRLMPESYGRLFRWAHRAILPLLGRRAARITTVSALSREHLVQFGIAPHQKIVVTYNGSDHARRWDPDRAQLAMKPARPFVLCLGQPQKYKNVQLLLRLAPLLNQMGLDLWMAGGIDMATLRNESGSVPDNVRLLGRISDDDFAKGLTEALCFLFPSRIEGFGLPVVEAMALGCPVVASTAPCLPEVCGDAALFADPDDVDGWLAAIGRLKDDSALRNRVIRLGRVRASAYSWRAIAERYLALMAEIDGITVPAGSKHWGD
jgi:glycosyltransferase involved in cell wall biosynthesis